MPLRFAQVSLAVVSLLALAAGGFAVAATLIV